MAEGHMKDEAAFPIVWPPNGGVKSYGFTKREAFVAIVALGYVSAGRRLFAQDTKDVIAFADALIAELSKETK